MAAQPHVLIKRYAKARLYNTATLSYVTASDLTEMVVRGERFTVCDADSGEDVTAAVLKQLH